MSHTSGAAAHGHLMRNQGRLMRTLPACCPFGQLADALDYGLDVGGNGDVGTGDVDGVELGGVVGSGAGGGGAGLGGAGLGDASPEGGGFVRTGSGGRARGAVVVDTGRGLGDGVVGDEAGGGAAAARVDGVVVATVVGDVVIDVAVVLSEPVRTLGREPLGQIRATAPRVIPIMTASANPAIIHTRRRRWSSRVARGASRSIASPCPVNESSPTSPITGTCEFTITANPGEPERRSEIDDFLFGEDKISGSSSLTSSTTEVAVGRRETCDAADTRRGSGDPNVSELPSKAQPLSPHPNPIFGSACRSLNPGGDRAYCPSEADLPRSGWAPTGVPRLQTD
jgi:hypothetical protein